MSANKKRAPLLASEIPLFKWIFASSVLTAGELTSL